MPVTSTFAPIAFAPGVFDTGLPTPIVGVDVPDHVAAALGRLCQQFQGKQNIAALVTALVQPVQLVESALWQLLTQRSITTALGAQLDALGKLVNQPRNGASDADYARFINARIATNNSRGGYEDLIAITKILLNNPSAQIVVDGQGVAALVVRVLSIVVPDALANQLLDFVKQGTAGGERPIVETLYAVDSDNWFLAIAAFASSSLSIGATTIPVNSTAGFPSSGSLDIDVGLAGAETVTYTGITPASFIGVSPLAANHVTNCEVSLSGSPGKGMGDTGNPATGGQLISARDAHYPAGS